MNAPRALLDVNVFISHLLYPDRQGTIHEILRSGFRGQFTLLLPQGVLEELAEAVPKKPYLAERITEQQLRDFTALLLKVAEVVPAITRPIPPVTRDPKDDYLLAYAAVGQADYLVTGDEDLLVLDEKMEQFAIVTPRAFLEVLQGEPGEPGTD